MSCQATETQSLPLQRFNPGRSTTWCYLCSVSHTLLFSAKTPFSFFLLHPFVAPTGTNTPEHLSLTYLNYYFCFLIHQNLTDLAVSWQENGEVTCWCPVTPNLKSSDSFLFLNTVTHPDSCSLVEFGTGSPRKGCETAFFLSVFLSVVFLNKLGDVISLSSNSFRQTLGGFADFFLQVLLKQGLLNTTPCKSNFFFSLLVYLLLRAVFSAVVNGSSVQTVTIPDSVKLSIYRLRTKCQ